MEVDEENSQKEQAVEPVATHKTLEISRGGKDSKISLEDQQYSATYAFHEEDHTLGNLLRN